ncbi:hypothetical protein E2C01_000722 [Portunus trituberculatus]|uniref:Uncharacterized protein n=1 Tax=Portunus trituberculatus TaxID=210409 RepID=A0A5B7CID5_PORTR|nr:hypothetical protein [Portunus trituberculatus]
MTQKGHLNRLKRKWWPNIDRNPEKAYPTPGFKEAIDQPLDAGFGAPINWALQRQQMVLKHLKNA